VFLRNVLRVYSYVFEGVLSLLAVGVAAVAAGSGNSSLHIGWLPFSEESARSWLIVLGLSGLLSVALAAFGILRWLLMLFAIAAAAILIKGLFLGSYSFGGVEGARNAVLLTAGCSLAVVGAIPIRRRQ
jgi:hypothetical protein